MTKRIYTSALLVVALAAGALAASLPANEQSESRVAPKSALLEMGKAWLREQARASTTSEVLTLNLTNLIILVVIKAIIFGFGFLGAGAGRSNGFQGVNIDQSDMMMMMSYSLGSTSDDYDCLYRVACEDPAKAHQYMTASKMLLKGAKVFKNVVGYNSKYEDVVYGIQEAIEFRNNGGQCSQQYVCKAVQ